jgi:hypothetical protein
MATVLAISDTATLYVGFSLLGVVLLLLLIYAGRYYFGRKSGSLSPGPPAPADGESLGTLPRAVPGTLKPGQELLPPEGEAVPSIPPIVFAQEENRILRVALAVLAWAVAVGLVLVLLPQGTFEHWAQTLRLRAAPAPQTEPIALIYLGDQLQGREMHIRGAVRNISDKPMENLDAVVRFKAADGALIETAIVRMDTDFIAPDATSTFNLVYPEYEGQFSSYSVDFKTRDGEPVPFKDLRGERERG